MVEVAASCATNESRGESEIDFFGAGLQPVSVDRSLVATATAPGTKRDVRGDVIEADFVIDLAGEFGEFHGRKVGE